MLWSVQIMLATMHRCIYSPVCQQVFLQVLFQATWFWVWHNMVQLAVRLHVLKPRHAEAQLHVRGSEAAGGQCHCCR